MTERPHFQDELFDALGRIVPDVVATVRNDDSKDFEAKFDAIIDKIPEGKRRWQARKVLRRFYTKLECEVLKEKALLSHQIEHLDEAVARLEKLVPWSTLPIKLQKPIASLTWDFQEALEDGRVFDLPQKTAQTSPSDVAAWRELVSAATVYLVNHDWAGAFKNAQDYIGGELHLPDDACAFEFRINDRHIIAFATDADGVLHTQITVQVKKGWVLFPIDLADDSSFRGIYNAVRDQVRAITIALDAEVATATIVREPHRSNKERERVGLPPFSYHVVNLARRGPRAEPLERNDNEPTRHKRLHFRRGHWRHFETFKTWIRWCLVGDPSLGFVDKEYRL